MYRPRVLIALALCLGVVSLSAFQTSQPRAVTGTWGADSTTREITQRIDTLERTLAMQSRYVEEARDKAAAAMEGKLLGMNEFRGTINDLVTKLSVLTEMRADLKALDGRVKNAEERFAAIDGQMKLGGLLLILLNIGVGIFLRRRATGGK